MTPVIVLLAAHRTVIAEGIVNILRTHDERDRIIVRISSGVESRLIKEIERIKPNVLIYDTTLNGNFPVHLLTSLLSSDSEMKVIVVGITSNWVQIISKRQFLVRSKEDLRGLVDATI